MVWEDAQENTLKIKAFDQKPRKALWVISRKFLCGAHLWMGKNFKVW